MPPPVTMIQDLEELEGSNPPHGTAPMDPGGMNMAKYLRGYHQPHTDSGMYEPPYEPQPSQIHMQPPPQFHVQSPPQFNCIDIANHIQSCPICSKFYNTDKTIYIVVIIFLCFICLLLMKRILNV
jgi:hypothetical protein